MLHLIFQSPVRVDGTKHDDEENDVGYGLETSCGRQSRWLADLDGSKYTGRWEKRLHHGPGMS